MSWFADSMSVYPLVKDWKFNVSQTGTTGTRVYLENLGQLSGITAETLPNVGTSWSEDYPYLTCKDIDVTFIAADPACGRQFVCTYDSVPFLQSETLSAEELPVSVDVGGTSIALEPYDQPTDGGEVETYWWHWSSDDAGVHQPIFIVTPVANLRFTKVVKNAKEYLATTMQYVGKLNDGTFFAQDTGFVMFMGCNMTQFKNKMGATRWKAELNFSINVRDWNSVMRRDASGFEARWDTPIDDSGDTLCQYADFDTLISENTLETDENQYNKFPEN